MIHELQILGDEHRRIRSMLVSFERELDRFEQAEGPDYEILGGSIAYCQDYLDHWHHPREDLLFDLLQRRAHIEAKACADLDDQHARLARITSELVSIFDSVQGNAVYERARLVEMGRILATEYRRHLDWEEANFFPAVEKHLLPEDWSQIARKFVKSGDPLIQNPVDQRYRALFIAIDAA